MLATCAEPVVGRTELSPEIRKFFLITAYFFLWAWVIKISILYY